MSERWLPVADWPGYEVSDKGRVRSWKRSGPDGLPRIRKASFSTNGYLLVGMTDNGRRLTGPVHRLVATAFIGPRPEGLQVRHLDGNKTNNVVENLTYGTRSENTYDSVRHGTHPMARKTHCKRGHEFTEENTRIATHKGRPVRICRTCKPVISRASYVRIRDARNAERQAS